MCPWKVFLFNYTVNLVYGVKKNGWWKNDRFSYLDALLVPNYNYQKILCMNFRIEKGQQKCSFWTKIIDMNYRHKVSWILCHIQCRISLTSIVPKKYVMVSYPSDNNNEIKFMNYVVTKNIRKKNCIWNFFILCVKSTSWYNWKVQIFHLCLDKAFTFTFSFG